MFNKFPLESDFIESYTNFFILDRFFLKRDKPESVEILLDAKVFDDCVHMIESNNVLSDCAERRDKTNAFIESLGDRFLDIKKTSNEKCASELIEAHNLWENNLKKDQYSAYSRSLISLKLKEKENTLFDCINNNLA